MVKAMDVDAVFSGPAVTLEQVLEARSQRAEHQQAALAEGAVCLVSFTLNIPGNIKQFPLARAAFSEGLGLLQNAFGTVILKEETVDEPTGSEALLVLNTDPAEIKRKTVAMEDEHPLGRLYDMDVLRSDGRSLSRTSLGAAQRTCLICGQSAKVCGRSRAHSLEQLRNRIGQLLDDHFKNRFADDCQSAAHRAMLEEVSATPKPGLVDRNNSGSHMDMDFFTFVDSAAALAPHFRRMFLAGWDHASESPAERFARLRALGQDAEAAMFAATRGVNTHKGLIFSLGLLSGALGAWRHDRPDQPIDAATLLDSSAQMARCSLDDFDRSQDDTNGLRCYRLHHLKGIRGEAAQGFPAVAQTGLPTLRRHLSAGLSLNDAACLTLLALISVVTDTNMIRRGGLAEALSRQQEAHSFLSSITLETLRSTLTSLDQDYISKNLSPGGCADLLALSLFLFFLEDHKPSF